MGRFKLSARDVAFVAIFAALSVIIVKVIPGVPIVGVPEASIKLDVALAPIYGLVVGPYLGFLAAFVGGLIAAGSWFSVLTSFCTAVSALVAGLLTQRNYSSHSHSVRGWMVAGVILCLLILGWYITWVGQRAPLYPVLHFSALLAILITRGWTATSFEEGGEGEEKKWRLKPGYVLCGILIIVSAYLVTKPYLESMWFLPYLSLPLYFAGGILILYGLFSEGRAKFAASVCLAGYCGIIADHMLGNLIFISVIGFLIPVGFIEGSLNQLNLPDVPSLFMYMIPISTIERIIFTAITTLIGVGLVLTLRKSGLLPRIMRRSKKG